MRGLDTLLRASGLTSEGLGEDHVRALAHWTGDEPTGCAAVEVLGDIGLLRSVAVAPGSRGSGLGTALVRAAESVARGEGIGMLYLLTETAAGFFAALSYRTVRREDVPIAVQRSEQYAVLCPQSAVVMVRNLENSD